MKRIILAKAAHQTRCLQLANRALSWAAHRMASNLKQWQSLYRRLRWLRELRQCSTPHVRIAYGGAHAPLMASMVTNAVVQDAIQVCDDLCDISV